MAWMRMMGSDSVEYHRETVLGRGDDHPGRALEYYASRGETPLWWGGAGAARLGLAGAVTDSGYEALFGPGGALDPHLGVRLVATRRPGIELVVAAHKSVALLGVIGRAEQMHTIMDAETSATMRYLDDWFQARGGRRGRTQLRTPTSGLAYAVTRHATSRAGDPAPHDHVLVANVIEMLDAKGGWKALDTAALRDVLHAATMAGRVAGAETAIRLGYGIEADPGPSGRLGHWRIAGIPEQACTVLSKRSDEIGRYIAERGLDGYAARNLAARATREVKRHTPPVLLLAGWRAELACTGLPVEQLVASVDRAALDRRPKTVDVAAVAAEVLGPEGRLGAAKVFTRGDAVVGLAPALYGSSVAELHQAVDRVLASADVVPLVGVTGAREQAYAPAWVLGVEQALAATIGRLADRPAPVVAPGLVEAAMRTMQAEMGRPINRGQAAVIEGICSSGRGCQMLVGVAGSGKTTCLDTVRQTFESAGYRVIGTSTSGQAARTLATEAGIESRTLASLQWRLDHHQLDLDPRTVVIVDEGSMASDPDLLRLVTAVDVAGARLIIVGDHRQLGAVGLGGAFEAVARRHPEIVHALTGNVRQRHHAERAALEQLRAGDVARAIDWYASNDRIGIAPTRTDALVATVDAWAQDVTAGHDTALLAWRRDDVRDLNRLARAWAVEHGRVRGSSLEIDDKRYAAGDRVVTLAPNRDAGLVTSQRGTILYVDALDVTASARMDDGRTVSFDRAALAADRVDHAYATTVHRFQGATVDRAHYYAAGGGRELAYVAMSRARHTTTIHTVADNRGQAIEDLTRDWTTQRRQQWVIDTARAAPTGSTIRPVPIDERVRRGALAAERATLARLAPPNPRPQLRELDDQRRRVAADLADVHAGLGRWTDTPAGHAARNLHDIRTRRAVVEHEASAGLSRRARREARASLPQWELAERQAAAAWNRHVQPEVAALQRALDNLDRTGEHTAVRVATYDQWTRAHPDIAARITTLDRALTLTLTHQPPALGARPSPERSPERAPAPVQPPPAIELSL